MSIDSISSTMQTSNAPGGAMAEARTNVMSAVATELGVTQTQLQSELQSGKSLSQLASAAGISSDKLTSTITAALQKSGLPAGTDLSAMATRMANRVGGQHHHHHAPPADSTDSTSDSSVVSALTSTDSSSSSVDAYL